MTIDNCHGCGGELIEFAAFDQFYRVTSDCKPWAPGGRLAWCSTCGLVQAIIDDHWRQDIAHIYQEYSLFQTSDGVEQAVFDAETGAASTRSDRILGLLKSKFPLASQGRLLDVGCGNGAFLKAFSKAQASWQLFGSDINDRFLDVVKAIPGVEELFVGGLEDVPGTYGFVSLIHSLEHIPHPIEFLTQIARLISEDGWLLVQVPDCEVNAVQYIVADHCSHFSPAVLRQIVERAGYSVEVCTNEWVAKEITLIARKARVDKRPTTVSRSGPDSDYVTKQVNWLRQQVQLVRDLEERSCVGLFGTAIAASWLFGGMTRKPDFFVDEDINRIGKRHLGVQVLSPAQIPVNSHVYVALPRPTASALVQRLGRSDISWQLPSSVD